MNKSLISIKWVNSFVQIPKQISAYTEFTTLKIHVLLQFTSNLAQEDLTVKIKQLTDNLYRNWLIKKEQPSYWYIFLMMY